MAIITIMTRIVSVSRTLLGGPAHDVPYTIQTPLLSVKFVAPGDQPFMSTTTTIAAVAAAAATTAIRITATIVPAHRTRFVRRD
jgi:hypothetical protein